MTDLERFRDHCRTKADDPETTAPDRALWLLLADEVDAYLTPEDVQEALL